MAEETVTISRKEYEELQKIREKNVELSKQVDHLWEQFRLLQKKQYGRSSEVKKLSEETIVQLGFVFNESEGCHDASVKKVETGEVTVKEHKRKQYVTDLENLPKNVEVEVIENDIPESERVCDQCGSELVSIGTDVKRQVKFIPAKFVIVETRTHSYKCLNCEKENVLPHIVRPEEQPSVIPGGNAAAEAIAYIAVEKYVMHSPLYRLEQQISSAGIPLSRQTMSNWLLKSTELYLEPVWKRMREKLLEEEILHADETTLQVIQEPNRKAETKSYMWLYRTGNTAKQQLILYDYQETREAKHPKAFLEGFKGYLHTDGYAGYHKLPPDIKLVGCMAHARRYFVEALDVIREENRANSAAARAVAYFDELFKLEESFRNLPADVRKMKRHELSEPVLNHLFSWLSSLNAAPKSLLGKAIHYALEQRQYLTAWLEDGRLEISNNLAERSIKPFVIGRKNFLFANTPSGAHSSAVLFSIIETAKANGLDPYSYLTWLLKSASSLDMSRQQNIDLLLPANAPDSCRSKAV